MAIKIQSFGGRIGWTARKVVPRLASWAYTKAMFLLRRKATMNYIDCFLNNDKPVLHPFLVSIETINRCNGTCAFCPCNINDEKRPFKQMTEDLFHSIVEQLISWNYKGRIVMNANNEPFMDTRIIEWTHYVRENLPASNIYLVTNGTLMTLEKFRKIAPFLNEININNYSDRMQLHENIREIIGYVKGKTDEFHHLTIDIQYRYVNEVLSNRNGYAPNKSAKVAIHEPCLEPFTHMVILPDGVIAPCCFPLFAETNLGLGNCGENTLEEIWNSNEYYKIRELLRKDRSKYSFCKYCDGFSKIIRTITPHEHTP